MINIENIIAISSVYGKIDVIQEWKVHGGVNERSMSTSLDGTSHFSPGMIVRYSEDHFYLRHEYYFIGFKLMVISF